MRARALVAAAALAAAAASPAAEPAPRPAAQLEFPAAVGIPDVPVENPHDYRGKPYCQWCHPRLDRTLAADPIKVCTQCHRPSLMKHPYGVAVRQVPAALPLGEGNTIICHTCHDPHDLKAHRKGLRLDFSALCEQCHAAHGGKGAAPSKPVPPPSHLPPAGRK